MPIVIRYSIALCGSRAGERAARSLAAGGHSLGSRRVVCSGAPVMMEHASSKSKPPLLAILVLACLLLLPLAVSSAPLSRSLSLRKNRPVGSGLEAPAQRVVGADHQEPSHGEVVAMRMDIEVNDYPGSGANNRHEPRSPGRV